MYLIDVPQQVISRIEYNKLQELLASIRRQKADLDNKTFILHGMSADQLLQIEDFIKSFTPLCNSMQALGIDPEKEEMDNAANFLKD